VQRGDFLRPFDGAFPFESGDADPSGDCGERRRLDRRLPDPEGLRAFNVHPDLTDLPEVQPVSIEINGHPVGTCSARQRTWPNLPRVESSVTAL